MAHKRQRDEDITDSCGRESSKRRQASFPQTPVPSTSSLSTPKSKTPYTPYPLRAFDSPSNPFGRRHVETLIHTLPPVTSFSKHLALRFQFVRRGISPKQGGVHRVVQVPLNYTFVHLRCLICFLFAVRIQEGGGPIISRMGNDDHLFEVKKDLEMYSAHYKPGQIKTGNTWAKLSSTQDPCRWRAGEEDLDEEEDELADDPEEEKIKNKEDENEEEGWEWKNEEEFTLGHAWPDGLNTERGIIYHHSRMIQVHISVNQVTFPRRRGTSNTPHVFTARGRVYISSPPLPRPLFNSPPKKVAVTRSATSATVMASANEKKTYSTIQPPEQDLTDTDADGDTDQEWEENGRFDDNHPFIITSHPPVRIEEDEDDDDDDDESEDISAELLPEKWNEPADKFRTYLIRFMGPANNPEKAFTLFDEDDDGAEDSHQSYTQSVQNNSIMSTPDLALSSFSSPVPSTSSSPLPSSSPFPGRDYQDVMIRVAAGSPFPLSDHYPNKKYKNTPAPPKARIHRMRIQRVEKRIEKSKKTKYLRMRDESVSADEQCVDELVEEEEEEQWVPPVLKEGEEWDPFGDEIEI